jgi:hypothetical protein
METKHPSVEPFTPPATATTPQSYSQGYKFHSSGMWNMDRSIEINGGRSVHFEVKNLSNLASTVQIKANNGGLKDVVILPKATADFDFSTAGKEPLTWRFDIKIDSDTAVLEWCLYSTWVPGDPENP